MVVLDTPLEVAISEVMAVAGVSCQWRVHWVNGHAGVQAQRGDRGLWVPLVEGDLARADRGRWIGGLIVELARRADA